MDSNTSYFVFSFWYILVIGIFIVIFSWDLYKVSIFFPFLFQFSKISKCLCNFVGNFNSFVFWYKVWILLRSLRTLFGLRFSEIFYIVCFIIFCSGLTGIMATYEHIFDSERYLTSIAWWGSFFFVFHRCECIRCVGPLRGLDNSCVVGVLYQCPRTESTFHEIFAMR